MQVLRIIAVSVAALVLLVVLWRTGQFEWGSEELSTDPFAQEHQSSGPTESPEAAHDSPEPPVLEPFEQQANPTDEVGTTRGPSTVEPGIEADLDSYESVYSSLTDQLDRWSSDYGAVPVPDWGAEVPPQPLLQVKPSVVLFESRYRVHSDGLLRTIHDADPTMPAWIDSRDSTYAVVVDETWVRTLGRDYEDAIEQITGFRPDTFKPPEYTEPSVW